MSFHNGEAFGAATVKFSFERAADKASTNKDKATFANIERVDTPDAYAVVLNLKNGDPDLLFKLGQATAVIVEPKSAATNAAQPVGTGPYKLDNWAKGSAVATGDIEDAYREASLGRLSSDQLWEACGVNAGLDEEYCTLHALTNGILELIADAVDTFRSRPVWFNCCSALLR